MGFSDRMRDSLGAEGARLEVQTPGEPIAPGGSAEARVVIHGGTRTAKVDALIVRVIEARRHWTDASGGAIAEAQAQSMDRSSLMPAWTRQVVSEARLEVSHEVDAGAEHEVPFTLEVPESCGTTDPACAITVNAQADIKGQIDPTANAMLHVRA